MLNKNTISRLNKQKFYLLVLLVYVAFIGIFAYYPMYGMLLAFKEYSFKSGIISSPWVGFKWFKMFFTSPDFFQVLRNTLAMSAMDLIFGFPAPILFALLLNEIRNIKFKRVVQSVSYLPHFISWIVVVGIAMSVLSIDGGFINDLLLKLGFVDKPIHFLGRQNMFWWIITILGIWKGTGWNSIIYLSAITSIDVQMYESAQIEGANKLQQVLYITLPSIAPTIIMLFVFRLGYILNVGFEQQLFLQNPMNYRVAEVIDTYVFKMGIRRSMFSYATAVGMFKSIIGLFLVLLANKFTRKTLDMGVF